MLEGMTARDREELKSMFKAEIAEMVAAQNASQRPEVGSTDWLDALAQEWESEAALLESSGTSVTDRTMNRIFAELTRKKIAELRRHAESASNGGSEPFSPARKD